MKFYSLAFAIFPVLAGSALADSLGIDWIDRVTHEIQKEDGPLTTKPLDYHVTAGIVGQMTNNLFLTDNREADGDYALTPFVGGTVEYTSTMLELSANLLVNYDYWFQDHGAREDEERFYGKARFVDGIFDVQLIEIARRESTPIDSIFADRAKHTISDTLPRVSVRVLDPLSLELNGQIQVVRYEGSKFDERESETYRGGIGALYDFTEDISAGLEGGHFRIYYRDNAVTPDAYGYFVRLSGKGEVFEGLLVTASLGATRAFTKTPQVGDTRDQSQLSWDVDVHVQWITTDKLTFYLDLIKRFSFAGSGSAFQGLNRGVFIAEWQAMESLKLKGRLQYDYTDPSNAPVRTFASASVGATYHFVKNVAVDGGVIYKWGDEHDSGIEPFDAVIFYLGMEVGF